MEGGLSEGTRKSIRIARSESGAVFGREGQDTGKTKSPAEGQKSSILSWTNLVASYKKANGNSNLDRQMVGRGELKKATKKRPSSTRLGGIRGRWKSENKPHPFHRSQGHLIFRAITGALRLGFQGKRWKL